MILNVAARVVCLVVLSALPFGCSKAPTVVLLTVSADATVPPVASIRVTLVQPKGNAMRTFRSLLADTDAGAEPFVFPAPIEFLFSDGVDDEATILVEGLDYMANNAVVARGMGTTHVKPQASVTAEVTISGVAGESSGDGGTTDGGADSDAANPDAI